MCRRLDALRTLEKCSGVTPAALRVGAERKRVCNAFRLAIASTDQSEARETGRGPAPTERITNMDNKPTTADEWLEKAVQYETQGKYQQAELCLKKAIAVEAGQS